MKRWHVLLGVTIVAAIGIQILEPDYNKLQTAANADAFRATLGDEKAGAIAATLCDFVFAAGYGTLAVIAFRALSDGPGRLVGIALLGGAAVFDEIENVFVLTNLSRAATTTDGWITAMTSVGYVKWTAGILGSLCLAGFAIARLARRRSG
jgi:hypothetical protein